MSSTPSDYRKSAALAILNSFFGGDESPPLERLETLMASKQPRYEENPLKYVAWWHEAMGRYCFAMADKFVKGYEAQREAWGRD